MKILVFGAGALGTAYAARLVQAGHEVTVLARGARLAQIRERGLVVRRKGERAWSTVPVACCTSPAEVEVELVVVLVRYPHMEEVLPVLARDTGEADLLVMVQNAGGLQAWRAALGERLVAGFAGVAGTFVDEGLEYQVMPRGVQPTTLEAGARSAKVAAVLEGAGFPTAICDDMDAWLRWHAGWIAIFANGVQAVQGDAGRFASRGHLRTLVAALRESAAALDAARVPIHPPRLRWLFRVPAPLLVAGLGLAFRIPAVQRDLIPNGMTAPEEARAIGAQLVELGGRHDIAMPAWTRLLERED